VPEASAGADIVILALPLGKYRSIPTEAVRGKPVIDAMNTGGKSTASATTDLAKVASLVHALGFDPVIAGPLAEGMRLEPGTEAFGAKTSTRTSFAPYSTAFPDSDRGRIVAHARAATAEPAAQVPEGNHRPPNNRPNTLPQWGSCWRPVGGPTGTLSTRRRALADWTSDVRPAAVEDAPT